MLGATGDPASDALAATLHNTLANEQIQHVSAIAQIPGTSSGTATILVDETTGQNRILVVPGANGLVDETLLAQPAWEEILWGTGDSSSSVGGSKKKAAADLLVLQLEIPLATVVLAIRRAKQHGVPVLLNPAPALPDIPLDVLAAVDHLVLNETEAEILVGHADGDGDGDGDGGRLHPGSTAWMDRIFQRFAQIGIQNVVVTLGAQGAAYSTARATGGSGGGGWEKVPAVAVPSEKVLDTTAAGDTWVGAYSVEVVRARARGVELDLGKAVARACAAAAMTVQRYGAIASIPFGDEY
jgi:ribokinase